MKRRTDWIASVLALLAVAAGCRDEGVTGPERVAYEPRGVPQATTIEVVPAAVTIDPGDHYWLTAILKDAQGQQLRGQPVHWTSSNADLVGVSAGDARVLVTAKSTGFATITAHYGALSSAARVTVYRSVPEAHEGKGELEEER